VLPGGGLVGCSDVPPAFPGPKPAIAQHPGRDLLEFSRDRQPDVLRFGCDTRIWPTKNISERGVRPLKTPAEDIRPANAGKHICRHSARGSGQINGMARDGGRGRRGHFLGR